MPTTKIEWCKNPDGTYGKTWNPIVGCEKVSKGCENCYALPMAWRLANNPKLLHKARDKYRSVSDGFMWSGKVSLFPERLKQPLRWRKPRVIFVSSMGDLFHEAVPADYIFDIFRAIARSPQHRFIILTKRPSRMAELIPLFRGGLPDRLDHLWLGVSVSSNDDLWMVEELLKIPAAKHIVSYEPALASVDLTPYLRPISTDEEGNEWIMNGIQGVFCGGETGSKARPMSPAWPRRVRDDCQAAGVPFFFKSMGAVWKRKNKGKGISDEFNIRQMP